MRNPKQVKLSLSKNKIPLITFLILLFTSLLLSNTLYAKPDKSQRDACKSGSHLLLSEARQKLKAPDLKPKYIKQRKAQLDQWFKRLRKGTEPCVVYEEMLKDAGK